MNDLNNITPTGSAVVSADIGEENIPLYIYRAAQSRPRGLLFLFDGVKRDASGIRAKAVAVADQLGVTLIAPLLDEEAFPRWRYNHAGVIQDDVLQRRSDWTGKLLQVLIDWVLERIDHDVHKVYLFGHSAGAQLLSRVCAYTPLSDVDAVIIANPSSYVMPLLDEPAPYGFRDLYPENKVMSRLRSYLAAPMTIYLGLDDIEDLNLSRSKYAMRQGKNRLERGRYLYRIGRQVAQVHRFRFNWRLVEIPGVGHSSRAMLAVENFTRALNRTL